MESTFNVGDKVRVGDKIGEIIRIDYRGNSTVIKVAFDEGPAKDFVSPPTKIEKILSPLEQFQNNKLDSSILFDLHYEATRLSLKPFPASNSLLTININRYTIKPYGLINS